MMMKESLKFSLGMLVMDKIILWINKGWLENNLEGE